MDWTGARTPTAAVFLARQGIALEASGDQVTLDHVWVEASLGGEDWVSLDPSYKTRAYQPGFVIPRIPFRRDEFLKAVTIPTASELYLDQIREYLRANQPGRSISDLSYTGPIQPVPEDQLPTDYGYTVTRV